MIHVAPGCAALDPGPARLRIDANRAHERQVDHQALVAHGVAGNVVAAAAHRHAHSVCACEADRGDDVRNAMASRDQAWPAIDHAIPDDAGRIIVAVVRLYQWASELRLEIADVLAVRAHGVPPVE